jgi:hypothetical protein
LPDLSYLASDIETEELSRVLRVARPAFVEPLRQQPKPWYLGPTFSASGLLKADADLILGGMLIEMKTQLGRKDSQHQRYAVLDKQTMRQLVGYVLHDVEDEYAINSIGLYEARYGHFATWPLGLVLDTAAGFHVDLATERKRYKTMLLQGDPALR